MISRRARQIIAWLSIRDGLVTRRDVPSEIKSYNKKRAIKHFLETPENLCFLFLGPICSILNRSPRSENLNTQQCWKKCLSFGLLGRVRRTLKIFDI